MRINPVVSLPDFGFLAQMVYLIPANGNIMINREQIKMDLSVASGSILGHLESFPDSLFYTQPAPQSWSAAQVAEHLVILEGFILSVINGPVKAAERPPDEQVKRIESVFTDRSKKYNAFELIRPGEVRIPKETLISRLREIRNSLFELSGSLDPVALCTGFEHRAFGMLTRYEWYYFVIHHSDRHLRQVLQALKTLSEHAAAEED